MADHPFKILQDAVTMYQSRVAVAIEERTERHRRAGMFVVMNGRTTIVPDMQVLCLDRDQVLARVDRSHPTVAGAVATMDGARDAQVPFGVLFGDGGVMTTLLEVHDAHRDRRD